MSAFATRVFKQMLDVNSFSGFGLGPVRFGRTLDYVSENKLAIYVLRLYFIRQIL